MYMNNMKLDLLNYEVILYYLIKDIKSHLIIVADDDPECMTCVFNYSTTQACSYNKLITVCYYHTHTHMYT